MTNLSRALQFNSYLFIYLIFAYPLIKWNFQERKLLVSKVLWLLNHCCHLVGEFGVLKGRPCLQKISIMIIIKFLLP